MCPIVVAVTLATVCAMAEPAGGDHKVFHPGRSPTVGIAIALLMDRR
ncbi:MAG: hypothetical protein AAFZ17_07320 [Cyanobacteria bacterium J06650_10]